MLRTLSWLAFATLQILQQQVVDKTFSWHFFSCINQCSSYLGGGTIVENSFILEKCTLEMTALFFWKVWFYHIILSKVLQSSLAELCV